MANKWYAQVEGEELGPVSDAGLQRWIETGRVGPETLLRNGRDGDWRKAATIGWLFHAEALEPAPPPTSRAPDAPQAVPHVENPPDERESPTTSNSPLPPAPALPPPPTLPPPLPSVDPVCNTAADTNSPQLDLMPAATGRRIRRGWIVGFAVAGLAAITAVVVFFAAQPEAPDRLRSLSERLTNQTAEREMADLARRRDETRGKLAVVRSQIDMLQASAAPRNPNAAGDAAQDDEAGRRHKLAQARALAQARRDDAAARREFDLQYWFGPDGPLPEAPAYASQEHALYEKYLAEEEIALAGCQAEQLAEQERAFTAQAAESRASAEKLLAAAEESLAQLDVALAAQQLHDCLGVATDETRPRVLALVDEIRYLTARRVMQSLVRVIDEASPQQIADWIARGELPGPWPDRVTDPLLLKALGTIAGRLLPVAWHNREQPLFQHYYVDSVMGPSIRSRLPYARCFFVIQAIFEERQRRLTADKIKQLGELYGPYGAETVLRPFRGLLAAGVDRAELTPLAPIRLTDVAAAADGKLSLVSCVDVVERCRQLAPDACLKYDAPHPLAGHWTGKKSWHLYVNSTHDMLVFARQPGKKLKTLAIAKIGRDYVVTFTLNAWNSTATASGPGDNDPFEFEKLGADDFDPNAGKEGGAAALTLFTRSGGDEPRIAVARRFVSQKRFQSESSDPDGKIWRELGDAKLYRPFTEYTYVDDRTAP